MSNEKVAVIMGSDSDYPVMKDCVTLLEKFGIECDVDVVSAHRTPEAMVDFAKNAYDNGYRVIVAAAGGAAHLPGMVASLTVLPVIGVPINITALQGLDALLSIVQMPAGVPVATMAIDNAKNAGLFAAEIIGVHNTEVRNKLLAFKKEQIQLVEKKKNNLKKS